MTAESKKQARTGVGLFLLLVFASSVFVGMDGERLRSIAGSHAISLYMWWVAASSMIARLLLREPFRDGSFRWERWATTRAMLVAALMPMLIGGISYGLAWTTGLARFSPALVGGSLFGFNLTGSGGAAFWKYLLVSWIPGGLWACKAAAGEEIGWRGYMLTRLIRSGVPGPVFVSGLVWALWHLPLILGGQYGLVDAAPEAIAVFTVNIVGLGYILAWLRLSSGSIWPCILAHGMWNALIAGAFHDCTRGGTEWVGESGVLTAIIVVLGAAGLNLLWPVRQGGGQPVIKEDHFSHAS